MYLFSRRARLARGKTQQALEFAMQLRESASRISGLEVRLSALTFSGEVGTLVWSTFVPTLAALQAANDRLQTDDKYLSALDRGAALIDGNPEDTLFQIVHGEPDPTRDIEYVTAVRTVCEGGKLARGLAVGIEVAQRAEKITGAATLFATEASGTFGGVAWFTGHANIEELERNSQALASDPSWLEFLDDEAGDVYSDDLAATTQQIYRRLA